MFHSILEVLLVRTTDEGLRQVLGAAIGGGGRGFELRYVSRAALQEVGDCVLQWGMNLKVLCYKRAFGCTPHNSAVIESW